MSKNKAVRKYVELELSGKTLQLCYDFNAICEAERLTRSNLIDGLAVVDIDLSRVRGMLFAACLPAQPKMTVAEVGDLIGEAMIDDPEHALSGIWKKIIEAWMASRRNPPQGSPEAKDEPDEAAKG